MDQALPSGPVYKRKSEDPKEDKTTKEKERRRLKKEAERNEVDQELKKIEKGAERYDQVRRKVGKESAHQLQL